MFRNLSNRTAALAATTLALSLGAFAAQAQNQERRARIDVELYTIEAEISPNTQSITAKAIIRFVPLDDNVTSAAFELNNALNVSRVVDDKGKQIPASRNQQDFTVRLSFEQPLPKGQPVNITFYYDGKLSGQEDSPVYGIKFAAIHPRALGKAANPSSTSNCVITADPAVTTRTKARPPRTTPTAI